MNVPGEGITWFSNRYATSAFIGFLVNVLQVANVDGYFFKF
jgi:hypothetical protein